MSSNKKSTVQRWINSTAVFGFCVGILWTMAWSARDAPPEFTSTGVTTVFVDRDGVAIATTATPASTLDPFDTNAVQVLPDGKVQLTIILDLDWLLKLREATDDEPKPKTSSK